MVIAITFGQPLTSDTFLHLLICVCIGCFSVSSLKVILNAQCWGSVYLNPSIFPQVSFVSLNPPPPPLSFFLLNNTLVPSCFGVWSNCCWYHRSPVHFPRRSIINVLDLYYSLFFVNRLNFLVEIQNARRIRFHFVKIDRLHNRQSNCHLNSIVCNYSCVLPCFLVEPF